MKTFVVKDFNGETTEVKAEDMGSSDEKVLYLLNDKNERVALFSPDSWISCIEKTE